MSRSESIRDDSSDVTLSSSTKAIAKKNKLKGRRHENDMPDEAKKSAEFWSCFDFDDDDDDDNVKGCRSDSAEICCTISVPVLLFLQFLFC